MNFWFLEIFESRDEDKGLNTTIDDLKNNNEELSFEQEKN